MIAVIVGVSETILFIIWQTPAPRSILTNHKKGVTSRLESKKNDEEEDVVDKPAGTQKPFPEDHIQGSLRHRHGYTNPK